MLCQCHTRSACVWLSLPLCISLFLANNAHQLVLYILLLLLCSLFCDRVCLSFYFFLGKSSGQKFCVFRFVTPRSFRMQQQNSRLFPYTIVVCFSSFAMIFFTTIIHLIILWNGLGRRIFFSTISFLWKIEEKKKHCMMRKFVRTKTSSVWHRLGILNWSSLRCSGAHNDHI